MTEHRITIGIVGGGKGGTEIFSIFSGSDQVRIVFLADRNPDAPAVRMARERGIPTYTDVEAAITESGAAFVVEATGSPKVLEMINRCAKGEEEIVTSRTALLLFNILEETRSRLNRDVFTDVQGIKDRIVDQTGHVENALKGIKEVDENIQLLALNASIEAAHAKEHGRGFSVVADAIKKTSQKSRSLIDMIESINGDIKDMSLELERSLERLK